jgi:hypothetical protein
MKHIKRFNEGLESNPKSFTTIYHDEIKSGKMRIVDTGSFLEVRVKKDSDLTQPIPELDNIGIKPEIESEEIVYWFSKPMKINFGDFITFDVPALEKLLSKSPEEIKTELQNIYNKKYLNNKDYIKTKTIRELFSEYIK